MPSAATKPRRIRPSRARGLRTSTGCLTCRKRRIKCDEGLPRCGQCSKSNRECLRGDTCPPRLNPPKANTPNDGDDGPREEMEDGTPADADEEDPGAVDGADVPQPEVEAGDDDSLLAGNATLAHAGPILSPSSQTQSFLLSATPFQWYDLLAQDAISDIQRHNDLVNVSCRWEFDEASLSRRPSPDPSTARDEGEQQLGCNNRHVRGAELDACGVRDASGATISLETSWNSAAPSPIEGHDLAYFRHYIQFIGPILDLFDPFRHFSNLVPHLALRNIGLLKSILAVAARHMSLEKPVPTESNRNVPFARDAPAVEESVGLSDPARMARQYYYETLRYLSQTLSYQSYADSHEILATAIMISTYEMLESTSPSQNDEWERHLRGGFWIQRCQDNDGESVDGLRRAVWWAWLRQDMWAALRAGRPTLTIWYPKKVLEQLAPDEFATRIVYIAAKVVEYAGVEPESAGRNIQRRIDQGTKLRDALRSWDDNVPSSFRPIATTSTSNDNWETSHAASPTPTTATGPSDVSDLGAAFTPIWIHPPSHAGAVQTYHFAMIILLLHMPTIGGLNAYRVRQQQLEQSVDVICGIASYEPQEVPLAFVSVQALYAAGLCVESQARRAALVRILERTLNVCKFPAGDLVKDLQRHWAGSSFHSPV